MSISGYIDIISSCLLRLSNIHQSSNQQYIVYLGISYKRVVHDFGSSSLVPLVSVGMRLCEDEAVSCEC